MFSSLIEGKRGKVINERGEITAIWKQKGCLHQAQQRKNTTKKKKQGKIQRRRL
jgi:hypothetical protein